MLCAALFFGAFSIHSLAAQVSAESVAQSSETAANPESSLFFEEAPAATNDAQPAAVSIFSVLKILVALALVACAIYGLVFLLKKTARGRTALDPFLKVLAVTPIDARNRAAVVAVGNAAYLVGSGENGVALIAEIKDKETVDALLLAESARAAENAKKMPVFADILNKFAPKSPVHESPRLKTDGIQQAKNRLGAV